MIGEEGVMGGRERMMVLTKIEVCLRTEVWDKVESNIIRDVPALVTSTWVGIVCDVMGNN